MPRDDWNLRERRERAEEVARAAGEVSTPAETQGGGGSALRRLAVSRIAPIFAATLVSMFVAVGCAYRIYTLWSAISASNASMGMRCSGPSLYLRERFDLPDRPGCVVLRVSGSAEAAGVKQGYLMVEMNEAPITSGPQYSARFYDELNGGDRATVQFKFVRPGTTEPVAIDVEWRAGSEPDEDPDDPIYYFVHARADEGAHPEEQIANYSEAIELAPDFDLALLYRGDAYWYDFSDYNPAYQDLTAAANLNSGQGEAQRELGWMAYRSADQFLSPTAERSWFDEAESFAHRAIAAHACEGGFEGTNYDCAFDYVLLANVLYRKAELAEAVRAGQRAIAYYPDDPQAHEIIAIAYAFLGERDRAIEHAKAYLSFPDDDTDNGVERFMRTLAKDPEQAKKELFEGR